MKLNLGLPFQTARKGLRATGNNGLVQSKIYPRQLLPDQLRGLALLGIVLVNAPFLRISGSGFDNSSIETSLDRAVAFLVTMLAQGKFYLIFSFLFGYSALFILKDGGKIHRMIYRRRLVALLMLGIVHLVFFFLGDILVSYATLGFGLLLLFARPDKAVARVAIVVGTFTSFMLLVFAALAFAFPQPFSNSWTQNYNEVMATGNFLDQALSRIQVIPEVLPSIVVGQWGFAFVAFCLGLLAARHQFLAEPHNREEQFRRAAIWGLGLGSPLQFATTWFILGPGRAVGEHADGLSDAASLLGILVAPVLTIGYIGAIAVVGMRAPRFLQAGVPAGRTSLTVYLGESVLLTIAFSAWGLGFFGQLGATFVTLLAILSWVLLVLAMTLWLRRFSRGPLEALIARYVKRPVRSL